MNPEEESDLPLRSEEHLGLRVIFTKGQKYIWASSQHRKTDELSRISSHYGTTTTISMISLEHRNIAAMPSSQAREAAVVEFILV